MKTYEHILNLLKFFFNFPDIFQKRKLKRLYYFHLANLRNISNTFTYKNREIRVYVNFEMVMYFRNVQLIMRDLRLSQRWL
jgi:hypothetical protein